MAERSAISWTDHSFAPWHGCTKVSNGPRGACAHCYAENLDDTRFHKVKFGNHPRQRSPESTWAQPRAWNRKAAKAGTRPFVFCSHLSDVFDNQVDPTWRADLFLLIHETPHLVWLLLTKRPQNILKMAPGMWPKNAAIGCTVVTQAEADRDLPILLRAAAELSPAFTFASMEPLMGPVDLKNLRAGAGLRLDALTGGWSASVGMPGGISPENVQTALSALPSLPARLPALGWVIPGGETDQGSQRARLSDPDWFRSLRDQCARTLTPFQMKQWGSWVYGQNEPGWQVGDEVRSAARWQDRTTPDGGWGQRPVAKAALDRGDYVLAGDSPYGPGSGFFAYRARASLSGRHLDGVLHDARPAVPRG